MSNAKTRKNFTFIFDFAISKKRRKEITIDSRTETRMLRENALIEPRLNKAPLAKWLKNRIPIMSEKEASYTRNSFFAFVRW